MSYPRKNKSPKNKTGNTDYYFNNNLGEGFFAKEGSKSKDYMDAIIFMSYYSNQKKRLDSSKKQFIANNNSLKNYNELSAKEEFILEKILLSYSSTERIKQHLEQSIAEYERSLKILKDFPFFEKNNKLYVDEVITALKNPKSLASKFFKTIETNTTKKSLPSDTKYIIGKDYSLKEMIACANDKELNKVLSTYLLSEEYSCDENGVDLEYLGYDSRMLDLSLTTQEIQILSNLTSKDIFAAQEKFGAERHSMNNFKNLKRGLLAQEVIPLIKGVKDPEKLANLKLKNGDYAMLTAYNNSAPDYMLILLVKELTYNEAKRTEKIFNRYS